MHCVIAWLTAEFRFPSLSKTSSADVHQSRESPSDAREMPTQFRELRHVGEAKGWDVVAEYTDAGLPASIRATDRYDLGESRSSTKALRNSGRRPSMHTG